MEESTNSCGKHSSSCTPDSEKRDADEARLLREIRALRILLADIAASTGQSIASNSRLCVIARLLPDLAPEQWNAFLAAHADARDFVALDLDPVEHPQLLGLCRGKTVSVCPMTGTLMPRAFSQQLGNEICKVNTDGSELTLALFAIDGLPCSSTDAPPLYHFFAKKDAELFPPSPLDPALCTFARLVRRYARVCDIPGRPAAEHPALIMPGLGPFRARALTERLIISFQEEVRPAGVTLRAGLAYCDAETGASADMLLKQANTAMALAQPGFSRTYRQSGTPEPERKTQVQTCEKAFLLFGDAE